MLTKSEMVRISTGSIEENDDASAPELISVQCLPSSASSIELSEHLVVPCNFLQEKEEKKEKAAADFGKTICQLYREETENTLTKKQKRQIIMNF